MPRRLSGLGGGSVRGLTSLLRELDPAVRDTLGSAFADAEDLIDLHSRTAPERQTRRRISGLVKTLVLRAESNLLGGFLAWDRLDDPRIAFYEVQTSDDNVFSSFESFPLLDTFFALENLRTTKYARVRGVRSSGDAGLFSNTVRLRPRISAPSVHSVEFYQNYSGADPRLTHLLRYSGGVDRVDLHPQFYTVLRTSFYADRLIGGLSIWGYLSSRLQHYRDGFKVPWDRVRFKVNGVTRTDGYFPHWTNVPDAESFNANDFNSSGQLMTFYGRGGYTASFGPYAVNLPNTLSGFGPNDSHSVVRRDALDATFYWNDAGNAARASRFDEAQFASIDDTLSPAHEASSLGIEENQKTEWLVFRDFRFHVHDTSVVRGIEAKIKRRQFSQFQNPLPRDNGNAATNLPFASLTGVQAGDIFEDDMGRFLNLDAATDLLATTASPDGAPLGLSTGTFSVTMWLNNSRATLAAGATNRESIWGFDDNESTGSLPGNHLHVRRNSGTASDELRIDFKRSGDNLEAFSIGNFFNTANEWIHLGVTWNGSDSLSIYKNGVLFSIMTTMGGVFRQNNEFEVQVGNIFNLSDQSFRGGISQIALFDGVLGAEAIEDIADRDLRLDLRVNHGDYKSAGKLRHYWLFIPDQADIRDYSLYLIDQTNTIRTDLDNKANTIDSWPRLSRFFYTSARQHTFLPLAVSDGIPHDNHTAIGYEVYGGETDLWGAATWTPDQVNSFYFGLAFRAKNEPLNGFAGYAFMDHAKLTVYTSPIEDRNIDATVEVAVSNEYYLQREVFGAVMNLLELGERLTEV